MKSYPVLPCPACRGRGYFLTPTKMTGCKKCNGFAKQIVTLDEVRAAYKRIRNVIATYLGCPPVALDGIASAKVEAVSILREPNPAIWFDVLYFHARELGLLDTFWEKEPKPSKN